MNPSLTNNTYVDSNGATQQYKDYTGTPQSMPNSLVAPSSTGVTPAITPPQLGNAGTPVNLTQPVVPPVPVTAPIDTSLQQTTDLGQQGQQAQSISDQILGLNTQMAGQSAELANQQNLAGVSDLQKQITDLTAKNNILVNNANVAPLVAQNNQAGTGAINIGAQRETQTALRENAIQAITNNSLLQSAQGNLSTAMATAKQATDAKYAPIEAQLTALQANLKTIQDSPAYSAEQKSQALKQQTLLQDRATEVAQKKQNDDAISALANTAMANNGGNPQVAILAQQAIASGDLKTAIGLLAQYQPDPQKAQKAVDDHLQAVATLNKTNTETRALNNPSVSDPIVSDPTSKDILSQTGLSIPAFAYLTQGSTALTRMTAPERLQYMNEVQNWAKAKGIDVSTFKAQYQAYNDVLQKNIARANQTQIFAGEVSGTADALLKVITPSELSSESNNGFFGIGTHQLSAQNVADMALGKQVNNPIATKYSFQIAALANDLAGYFAASRGATSPDDSDLQSAGKVISNGMNSGSVQAFKDSINANEEKVSGVVNKAVDSTQKQVWSLFGVGGNYKSPSITPIIPSSGSTQVIAPTDIPAGYYQASDGKLYKK